MEEKRNQFTKEEAVAYAKSSEWKNLTDEQIFLLQMHQQFVCVDWSEFRRATEEVLGRGVYTHEFASPELLLQEHEGAPAPTLEEIIDMIPKEKLVMIAPPREEE